jgi:RNA polymerase sigma-70 factor (ECF subfamily)
MSHTLQEKVLLFQVRVRKDPDAFAKIYDLYATRIHRFVYFKVSSEEEAQDITADVFLKAWQYLLDEQGKEVRHLSALLYSIARNKVIDLYRSRALRDTLPLSDDAEDLIADERMDQSKTEARLDSEMLEKHLRSLKDEYREVLVLKYLDELNTSEIAKILGKQAGNVRVLLHRATEALRDIVAKKESHETHEERQARGTTASP